MLVLRDGSTYSRGNTLSIGRFLVQAWIVSAVLPAMSTAVNSPSVASYKNVSHPSLTSTLGHTTAVSTKSPYFKIFTSKAPVPSQLSCSSSKPRPRKHKQKSSERELPVPVKGTQRSIRQFFSKTTNGPIRNKFACQNGVWLVGCLWPFIFNLSRSRLWLSDSRIYK